VCGFLAGTVKKKLGLTLTSSKDDGGLRRYADPDLPLDWPGQRAFLVLA